MLKFCIHDLREVFGKSAKRIMTTLHASRQFSRTYKSMYIPVIRRGKETEQLQCLTYYDLDEIIPIYEARLTSPNHAHVFKRSIKYLEYMHTLRDHLNNQ